MSIKVIKVANTSPKPRATAMGARNAASPLNLIISEASPPKVSKPTTTG